MMMMMKMMILGAIGGMNLAGETDVLEGNLPRRHFVHHKIPHDDPVSNPGPQRWEASHLGHVKAHSKDKLLHVVADETSET
jgi:hypothetical protein